MIGLIRYYEEAVQAYEEAVQAAGLLRDEVKRLRALNAELLAALKQVMANGVMQRFPDGVAKDAAIRAIAKAEGVTT